jgi:uncharacterized protein (TIGR03435 family)
VITRRDDGARLLRLRDRPLRDFLTIAGASSEIGGPIVDRTGLSGRFDIDLEYSPSSLLAQSPGDIGVPFAIAAAEQLGLRFEKTREPVDVLVVDTVSMPTLD